MALSLLTIAAVVAALALALLPGERPPVSRPERSERASSRAS